MPDLMWFLLIGLCAGWLAGMFTNGRGFGVIGNMIVGMVGALVGVFLLKYVGRFIVDLLVATAGAIVLITVLRLVPMTGGGSRR
jgi:uncharacterized membrane protein YeaQ/YmgE (transglycosylase-associated protein family)